VKVRCPNDDVCGDGKAGGFHCEPHEHTEECDVSHGEFGFCPPCVVIQPKPTVNTPNKSGELWTDTFRLRI